MFKILKKQKISNGAEFKNLEKKLKNIKTPEIEIQGHKQRLKMALLSSGYFTPFRNRRFLTGFKEKTIMFWTKRLVPAGVALALILVVGLTVVQPKLQIAKAMEIAKNNPQIKQLMEDYGVEIKEVKLQGGKAYVLLALPEEKIPSELEKRALVGEETGARGTGQTFTAYQNAETGEIETFSGSVAEIDLKEFKVKDLKKIGIVEPIEGEGPAMGKYKTELETPIK